MSFGRPLVRPGHRALDQETLADAGGLAEPGHEVAADHLALGGGQLKVIAHVGSKVIEGLGERGSAG